MSSDFSKLGAYTNSSDENWDIVTIGAGHNSLIASAYLAMAGKKVLVLERNRYAGGGVASMEMSEPGFHSERHAALHHLILANPLMINDELGLKSRFGLKYLQLDVPYGVVFDSGCLALYQDRKRTMEGIAKFSKEDAEAYDRFMDIAIQVTDVLIPSMFEPPRDLSEDIVKSPVANFIAEASQKSSYDVIRSWFKHDVVQLALVRLASEVQLAHPRRSETGLICYTVPGMLEKYGMAIPQGGGAAFTDSVIRCIMAYGGDVRLNTEATKVVVEDGRATAVLTRSGEIKAKEAIIGSIHPHLLPRFVDTLEPKIAEDARNTKHSDYTGFVIHAALKEPLKFKAGPTADSTVMNTICAPNMATLLENYDYLEKGILPKHAHFGASCTSQVDRSRAPAGKATLHLFCMTRYKILEGQHKWDEIKDSYTKEIFRQLQPYTLNLTPDLITSYHVVTPLDHERDTPSFQAGDICGLAHFHGQMGLGRPTPELAQYRVPGAKGLYLAGPFMHPGGGVWGGGRPVARRVLEDLDIDFDALFVNGTAGLARL
ncbi:hypothetical protein DL95DRAFT_313414 [Leptodontidium sp. 2 PMI_412]|nr:hypothetical protein DL95DRAFT_313414 [Leptodontidium sp. 2 PMI_412]